MKISQEDAILIFKNLNLSRGVVHEGCYVNFPTRVKNLEASSHRQSAAEIAEIGTWFASVPEIFVNGQL